MKQNYYTLKELIPLANINYRQLQNRILTILQNHINNPTLIHKQNGRWNIHHSIINEFVRVKNPINYKLFTTISSRNDFSQDYWKVVIKSIDEEIRNNLDKNNRTKYVIELNQSGVYHLHFMTTFNNNKELKSLINNNRYINNNNMNILIKQTYDVDGLHKYFRKTNKPILIKLKI